jgi:hypothetical protein
MNFASDYAFCLNLDASLREYHSIEPPGDHHAVPFDLSFDFGAFAQDYRLLGNDIALHIAVDAKCPCELKRAFKGHTLIDESGPLFAHAIL